jgi:hypothetical protein
MNCKPGDLAIIIRESEDALSNPMAGRMVEVLYANPSHSFELPDGTHHEPGLPGFWVCKSLGSPWNAPVKNNAHRLCMYGSIPDRVLRPLPGVEALESIEVEAVS